MRKHTLREALSPYLGKKELMKVKRAMDVVGDIAIVEIDDGLKKKEKVIGKAILDTHKHIKVVCRKAGKHIGEFRRQKLRIIAGERRKETIYKENDCRFMLHVEKVYFSPRLSTERKRIFQQVKNKEKVLVMFSGVGPYPIVISKNSRASEITAVEKNPDAHRYAQKNTVLNKRENIVLYLGDVRKIVPKLKKFDRIIMPLPKGGEDFLDVSLGAIKKGGIIHFYDFLHESEFPEAGKKVRSACSLAGKRFRTVGFRKCGQSAPRFYRVVLDFRVLN